MHLVAVIWYISSTVRARKLLGLHGKTLMLWQKHFALSGQHLKEIEPHFELIKQFIVLLYDHTTSHTFVNQARKDLFAQKGRTSELIHPTQAALIQHVKRATYQAGYCWAQSCIAAPEMPSPSVWGSNDTGKGDVFGHIYPKQLGLVERIASMWMQNRMLRAM